MGYLGIHQKNPGNPTGSSDGSKENVNVHVPRATAKGVSSLTITEADIQLDHGACARAPPKRQVQLTLRDFFEIVPPNTEKP